MLLNNTVSAVNRWFWRRFDEKSVICDFQSADGRQCRPIDVAAQREKPRRGNYLASRFRFFEHVCAVGLLLNLRLLSLDVEGKGYLPTKNPFKQVIRPISIIRIRRAI